MAGEGRCLTVASPHCGLGLGSSLGGERYERALLERLPAHGIALEIGLPRARAVNDVPPGWSVQLLRPAHGLRWWVAPIAFVPFTFRAIRRSRAALLRAHSVRFVTPSLLLARRLARSHVPVVVHHLHTDPRWWRLEAPLLRRADAVITISRRSAAEVRAAGVDSDRIYVIPPGVDAPVDVAAETCAWPTADALRVLHLGRLEQRKRPRLAIRGFAEAVARGLDATLLVAGDGPLRKDMERLVAQLGIEERVSWRAHVDDDAKWGLLRGADVLVATSSQEGFGLVVAEAHAAGTPVLTTSGTATEEIVRNGITGLVVDADPSAVARGLETLEPADARASMGDAARRRATELNWERCAAEVAAVYRRVVAV